MTLRTSSLWAATRSAVDCWLRIARVKGEAGLRAKKHPGPQSKPDDPQKRQIFRWIKSRNPRQYGFDFGLWTRKLVQELIAERFGIQLGLTGVGRVLAELEITPQKPLRRACERDPEAIQHWTEHEYPRLRARSFFSMRRGFAQTLHRAARGCRRVRRRWSRRGPSPIRKRDLCRERARRLWVQGIPRGVQPAPLRRLLEAVHARPTYSRVLDRGRTSFGSRTEGGGVRASKGRLELHFFPGYAPELNPGEFVWNPMKTHGISKKPLREEKSLFERVQADLEQIKRLPSRIRSFFRVPST